MDGLSGYAVAEKMGCEVRTVYVWRDRFLEGGLEALADKPRSGQPRKIQQETVEKALARLSTFKAEKALFLKKHGVGLHCALASLEAKSLDIFGGGWTGSENPSALSSMEMSDFGSTQRGSVTTLPSVVGMATSTGMTSYARGGSTPPTPRGRPHLPPGPPFFALFFERTLIWT